MTYLFVCTGNTCRSPMAEAIMRKYLPGGDEVRSAGVAAAPGSPITENSARALEEIGIVLDHCAQTVSSSLLAWADKVLCMEAVHKERLLIDFPSSAGKIMTIAEWANADDATIADPYGGTMDDYRRTRDDIMALISKAGIAAAP